MAKRNTTLMAKRNTTYVYPGLLPFFIYLNMSSYALVIVCLWNENTRNN